MVRETFHVTDAVDREQAALKPSVRRSVTEIPGLDEGSYVVLVRIDAATGQPLTGESAMRIEGPLTAWRTTPAAIRVGKKAFVRNLQLERQYGADCVEPAHIGTVGSVHEMSNDKHWVRTIHQNTYECEARGQKQMEKAEGDSARAGIAGGQENARSGWLAVLTEKGFFRGRRKTSTKK